MFMNMYICVYLSVFLYICTYESIVCECMNMYIHTHIHICINRRRDL
jgi:hypothetical protein